MQSPAAATDEAPLVVVLDTNTLLDWHVFRDPAMHPIADGIRSGRLRWLACPAMQREWGLVWPRPGFARWRPDPLTNEAAFGCAEMVADPPRGPMRCTDPDDQVFIDLALACKARWLLSKDRALLKLARRARALGLSIQPPASWAG
ncbi:MAG: PIN domain-containing protein [Aquabacterium sp.]|jgi:predicted nucleic acid-binding protein|nr:MAG: PIN domain-containing protein [Aquabacterium sp.]